MFPETPDLATLLRQVPDTNGHPLITRAYAMAEQCHAGQTRASGEPYITHPLNVARFLADMGFDAATIAAGLLHDALEDSHLTRAELERDFGSDVAFLVDGVTKLSAITLRGTHKNKKIADLQTESLKKMFFAMADDLRVIIIKLADRLHNMTTLKAKPAEDRVRIARETMEIYAPIADRLGMGRLKGELEDLSFPFVYPEECASLKRTVKHKYEDRLHYIERAAPMVRHHLITAGITVVDMHARAKRMWSLYQKLKRYEMDPDKVMDLVALRIIVPDVKSCYEALGIIHAHYKPMPGRIKDFIALPKPNGYRSLHTTVFCEKGRIAEIQIRTPDMHDHAENGVAAHWAYAEQGKHQHTSAKSNELAWVNQLKLVLRSIQSSAGMANLKIDFFQNRIFVLTPNGDVKDLPDGATPVDFAFAVHSELGYRMTGALVNGRIVPLTHALHSGDVVEVIKQKEARPSKDWLRFVRTTQAAKHIRSWLKKNDPSMAIDDGRELLDHELARGDLSVDRLNRQQINQLLDGTSAKSLDDLLTHISMRDFDATIVARILLPTVLPTQKSTAPIQRPTAPTLETNIRISGQHGLAYKIGKCCAPLPADAIIGYLTLSRGVTVHKRACANIKTANERRLMDAQWE